MFDVTIKGVVLEDTKEEVNKNGQNIVRRRLKLYQQGKKELLEIDVPLDYKRKAKNGEPEEFFGTFYTGSFKGRDFRTLKVASQE